MEYDEHTRKPSAGHDAGGHHHHSDRSGTVTPAHDRRRHDRRLSATPFGRAATRNRPLSARSLGTVLAVWAHPDDESFVAGGLLAAASDAGSRVVCLTATRGELGTADPDRWHPDRLGRTRQRELAAAQAVLGIDEQRWLPFEDGSCHQVSPGIGTALVAQAIADVRPDTIVTFGPDGLTGHSDHQAVARWAANAWAAKGGNARLLWATVTADAQQRMSVVEPIANAFYPGYPRVTPDDSVALRLDLTGDLLDRKFSAIRAHATQSAALVHQLGEDSYRRWWSTETYIDVGAIPRPTNPVRRSRRRSDPVTLSTRPTTRSIQCTAHT